MSNSSVYREIDVQKQHTMSLRETWTLCVRGVKHRLFRSMLTLAVVVLAVAFFMFLLSESIFQRSVAGGVMDEDAHARFAQTTLTRLLSHAQENTTVRRLADAARKVNGKDAHKRAAGHAEIEEASHVTGLPVAEVSRLAQLALQEATYTTWLDGLPTGHRLNLIGKRSGRAALNYILETSDSFHEQLKIKIEIRVPGKIESLDAFLAAYPAYKTELSDFNRRWNAAVSRANEATDLAKGGQTEISDARWIPAAAPDAVDAWRRSMTKLGFTLSEADVKLMREQLAESNTYSDLIEHLNRNSFRTEWARQFNETKRSSAEEKMAFITDRRAVRLLEGSFSSDTLQQMSDRYERVSRLSLLNQRLAMVTRAIPSFLGLTGRQLFLLFISFLVCMVGITNAMLMSITERYREIATMKCLGATDAYILSQFMMEAAMQGAAGGVIGVVVGFLISVVRCSILYGAHLWTYFPGVDIIFSALFSLAAGILLAALASIQPSWSASRMAPMEAMRVE